MASVKIFLLSLLFMIILDMIWLGVVARNLYMQQIGLLMRKANGVPALNWSVAFIVYLLLMFGIFTFVLPKANGNLFHAVLWGGLFGAIIYGIYDFTNLATLANWPLTISIIDLIWGIFLCAATSVIATKLLQVFQPILR